METSPRQLWKSKKETRRKLVQQFKETRQNFISDVVEGRRAEELYAVKVWKIFWLGPVPIPYYFRLRTVIDLRLLETRPRLRLTTAGQLVNPPALFMVVWTTDRAIGVRSYSNDELSEMIKVFALPPKPTKQRWLEPTRKRNFEPR